jgi:hypothetical protein
VGAAAVIKHVVLWKLKPHALGNDKHTNARLLKQKLEALAGRIPGLLKIEVGLDFSGFPDAADVVLYSEFDTRESLRGYYDHPAHQEVVPFAREVRAERCVIDYEVP